MTMRRVFCGVMVLALLVAGGMANAAARYDRLYVFGDSFSDTGAGFHFSNGPSATAQLARRLDLDFTHSKDPRANTRSISFAVAGAGTGVDAGRQIGDFWLAVGMRSQVDDFVARVRRGAIRFNPETTLFFIEGGLNDAALPTQETLDNLTRQIEALESVGARHVSLALLPTRIPGFDQEGLRLNPAYRQLVPALRERLGIDLRLNGFGTYLDDIHAHPARHGIVDIQSRCAPNPLRNEDVAPCAAPDTYFYYYDEHPSAAVNRIVGDRLYTEIVERPAEPSAPRP